MIAAVVVFVMLTNGDDTDRADDPTPSPETSRQSESSTSSDSTPSNLAPSSPSNLSPSSASSPTQNSLEVPLTAVLGTWSGTYSCGQGLTRVDLEISPAAQTGNLLAAVFRFGPDRTNPDVPEGAFQMRGAFSDGELELVGTTWLKQPRGYVTIDLSAKVLENAPQMIRGTVDNAPECTTFEITRRQ